MLLGGLMDVGTLTAGLTGRFVGLAGLVGLAATAVALDGKLASVVCGAGGG